MDEAASSLLHLSDLHIGRDASRAERAAALIRRALATWGTSPDKPVVLITGDLVDDGQEAQYLAIAPLLAGLRAAGFPVVCVPGNHDYGHDGCRADPACLARFQRHIASPLGMPAYPVCVRVPGWAIVCLDSMQAEAGRWDGWLADGEIGSEQRVAAGRMVAGLAPEREAGLRVAVALHHHPFIYPDDPFYRRAYEWFGHRLKDGDELLAVLAGRADLLLFGHEHRHIDFARDFPAQDLPRRYAIPSIVSCGSSTAGKRDVGWLIQAVAGAGVQVTSW
jgi:3',5'-cyclic AMP phosphodiesterase CpdA